MKYYGRREKRLPFTGPLTGLDEQELVMWRGILGGSTRVCQAPGVLAYDPAIPLFGVYPRPVMVNL